MDKYIQNMRRVNPLEMNFWPVVLTLAGERVARVRQASTE
jgi:hypothetical protein